VPRNNRVKQEEQLVLPLGEVTDARQQDRRVLLLLAPHHRRWMLARNREVRTVVRTRNLDQTLRSTAHAADRLA